MSEIKPLTQAELIKFAIDVKPLPIERVLATFADPCNWDRMYDKEGCHGTWTGPVLPPYELAELGLRELEK